MLATLAQLKARFPVQNTPGQDAALTALLEGLSERFAQYCGRVLLREVDAVERFDALSAFVVKRYPVESLSLWFDAQRVFDADTLLTVDQDYVLDAERGLVRMLSVPEFAPGAMKVVVTGGYVSAGTTPAEGQFAVPADLELAVLMQAEHFWRLRPEKPADLLTGSDFLPEVKNTLESYKRITF